MPTSLLTCNLARFLADYQKHEHSQRSKANTISDKDVPDANEVETSMLGLQSYWDATYAEDLANFHEHSHAGEVWFGIEVTDAMMTWTEGLYANMSQCWNAADNNSNTSESRGSNTDLSSLSVLDIGTGNGLLLQEFAKQGNFPGVYLI